jgi:hypothetical protein
MGIIIFYGKINRIYMAEKHAKSSFRRGEFTTSQKASSGERGRLLAARKKGEWLTFS